MNIKEAKRILQSENCEDLQEFTKQFRKLALQHHPDKGGNTDFFIKLKEAYDFILQNYNRIKDKNEQIITDEVLNSKIMQTFSVVMDLSVKFEIIGYWIWASGNTFLNKESLKTLGFKFSKKKLAWYWVHPEHEGRKTRKNFTIEQLRRMHGFMELEQQKVMQLA